MNNRIAASLLLAALLPIASAQQAAPRNGRGNAAIPNATVQQTAALAQMTTDLAPLTQAVATARSDLYTAAFAQPKDDAAVAAKVDALKTAELHLAAARADALATLQKSAEPLAPNQLTALADQNPRPATTFANSAGYNIPRVTSNQIARLTDLTGATQKRNQALDAARVALGRATLAQPRDDTAIKTAVDALAAAEKDLATTRADTLAALQSSPDALAPDQLAALVRMGGIISSGAFSEPKPLDFSDHEGYVSLFDGKTLKGWDGNPKFWRVEDGAIIGESTPQNPSGNSYLACRDLVAHDFTLKFEIKVEGAGGSGIQYRSKTGVPWLTPVQTNVTANVGPTNLDWMMTGPQADFWPSRDTTAQYSGQFYSENTPMRIMAFRGQVVEGAGMGPRKLLGNIGDRMALGKLIKLNDWNQYTVIARGPTFLHIVNGQLMSAMIDDDPTSSNNQPGLIGIEIEATTKLYVRNIWIKKIN